MYGSQADVGIPSPTEKAWLYDLEVTVLPGLPHASEREQGESVGLAEGEARKDGTHDS